MSTYVVMPAINELANLKILVPAIKSSYPDFKLLIVDGSQDTTTRDWISQSFNENQVKVLFQTNSTGFASAVILGLQHAVKNEAKWVFQIDADGTHPIRFMKEMLKIIQENSLDLVIGSRWKSEAKVKSFKLHRKILSYASKVYCQIHLGWHVSDWTSGYKVMNQETAKLFIEVQQKQKLNSFAFQAITTKFAILENKKVAECSISLEHRMSGNSKLQIRTILEALRVIGKF